MTDTKRQQTMLPIPQKKLLQLMKENPDSRLMLNSTIRSGALCYRLLTNDLTPVANVKKGVVQRLIEKGKLIVDAGASCVFLAPEIPKEKKPRKKKEKAVASATEVRNIESKPVFVQMPCSNTPLEVTNPSVDAAMSKLENRLSRAYGIDIDAAIGISSAIYDLVVAVTGQRVELDTASQTLDRKLEEHGEAQHSDKD